MFDTKLTAHLAELSKLEFTETELEKIAKEMDDIIALMDTVSDFEDNDTTTVNSAVGIREIRADEAKSSFDREDILKNAKHSSEGCFTVPKVV
ncbi:MAG: Asp-tRNA(Asn)/Glu-tRNA(Gln) amidotransferase subunit GatC [Acutalibacteraceae bacterium]|nr:Asp-tRNA(Asn)/Glu-tRNA(Gln) amidotransferase subunit GatC [Acutalibacteraceae bacterium]